MPHGPLTRREQGTIWIKLPPMYPRVRPTLTWAGVFLAGFGLPSFTFTGLPVHLGAGGVAEPDPCDHAVTTGHGTGRPRGPVTPATVLFN